VRRVFLDANVIFSAAHNPEGNASALFKLAGARKIEVVSSRYALEEAARNIALKFPQCVAEFDGVVSGLLLTAEPTQVATRLAEARASVLITGDRRDFGHLYGKTIEGALIIAPAEALSMALDVRRRKGQQGSLSRVDRGPKRTWAIAASGKPFATRKLRRTASVSCGATEPKAAIGKTGHDPVRTSALLGSGHPQHASGAELNAQAHRVIRHAQQPTTCRIGAWLGPLPRAATR